MRPLPPDTLVADPNFTPEQLKKWGQLCHEVHQAHDLIRQLQQKILKLESQNAEQALPAILTRPEFNREVARMLAFDERYGGTSSVLYFNFDNLEGIASRHGQSVLNAVVATISNIMGKNVRGSDIVGRLAVDEFGVLLSRCDNAEAWQKGEALSRLLNENLRQVQDCILNLEISFGAYTFRDDKEDISTGLRKAADGLTRS